MLNIGEFARLGQVSPRMLRYYDRFGLLVPDRVDPDTGATGTAAGLAPEHIGPLFMELVPRLAEHLTSAGAEPGVMVGHYDEPRDDGSVAVHVGFEVGDQSVPDGDGIEVVKLPVIEVASVIHRGEMANIGEVYESTIRWIEDSGLQLAGYSRELCLQMDGGGPSVTDLQLPIAR